MTITPAPETWFSRDLPVLSSVVARVETAGIADSRDVITDTGLDPQTVGRSARALHAAGYFEADFELGGGFAVMHLGERARREVGSWPTPESLADRLTAAVERGLAQASTDDERSRWQKLAAGIASAGREIVVQASGAALGGAIS